jgi:serine/threonine protein kinase
MIIGVSPFYHDETMKLYENILNCKPRFNAVFHPDAKDLIKKFLVVDLSFRFGNLKGGVEDIKTHKWFADLNWDDLANARITAPYIPNVNGPNDSSHFDEYDETHLPYGQTDADQFGNKFKDF